jgi:hypothetical protein
MAFVSYYRLDNDIKDSANPEADENLKVHKEARLDILIKKL